MGQAGQRGDKGLNGIDGVDATSSTTSTIDKIKLDESVALLKTAMESDVGLLEKLSVVTEPTFRYPINANEIFMNKDSGQGIIYKPKDSKDYKNIWTWGGLKLGGADIGGNVNASDESKNFLIRNKKQLEFGFGSGDLKDLNKPYITVGDGVRFRPDENGEVYMNTLHTDIVDADKVNVRRFRFGERKDTNWPGIKGKWVVRAHDYYGKPGLKFSTLTDVLDSDASGITNMDGENGKRFVAIHGNEANSTYFVYT